MFSYLFEQYAATFGAEYEFIFVNKTPDNRLVFSSKTDLGAKTILLFEPASASDINLLGISLSQDLYTIANDLQKFSSSLKLTYQNKDILMFLSMDEITRNITFTSAVKKSNTSVLQSMNFSTPFVIQGDSMVFESRLTGNFVGVSVNVKGLLLDQLSQTFFNGCASPIALHELTGKTSQNDNITLGTALADLSGGLFAQESDFYFAPLVYIFNNGVSMGEQIPLDVTGAVEMHLYYNIDLGGPFYGIGLVIQNPDGSVTFALREFTPVVNGNNLVFNFEPTISIFGSPTTANVQNLNTYLNALSSGDNTYVFKLNEGVYEFHNPCTGWSFVFIDAN
jgi:hypothetical protein